MVIDYSKWDNIDISDDDSEHDDLNAFKENFELSDGFKKQIVKEKKLSNIPTGSF